MGRGGENFENFECCLKSMVYGSRVPKVLDLYHVCMYVNHYKQRVFGTFQFCPHIRFFWNYAYHKDTFLFIRRSLHQMRHLTQGNAVYLFNHIKV